MTEGPRFERRAAHERLATGGLARWARFCATHPGRIFLGWLGIVAALIVLVIGFGGGLKDAVAKLQTPEFAPTEDRAGIESVGDPFSEDTVSDDGRIAYAEAQFNETIETEDRDEVVAVQDEVRETVEPAGITAEFNGDAEFPPIEQGIQELLGLFAALIVLMIVFRTFVTTMIPIALAIVAVATAFI